MKETEKKNSSTVYEFVFVVLLFLWAALIISLIQSYLFFLFYCINIDCWFGFVWHKSSFFRSQQLALHTANGDRSYTSFGFCRSIKSHIKNERLKKRTQYIKTHTNTHSAAITTTVNVCCCLLYLEKLYMYVFMYV